MARDSRYDVLFEPVRIGPVTAPNRFYQVPHCNGMGTQYPSAMAAMRGLKAEGGWGVVCTEECDFHPSGEYTPAIEARLWDEADIPIMARMVDAVHEHGALAGCELTYGGPANANLYSRLVPLAPVDMPVLDGHPLSARAMDKQDIRDFRRWHRDAVLRAKSAGFDLVYVYAAHNLNLMQHFISRRYNTRTDEYGGSLENRVRLFREVLEETKEAVGDTMAVAVRFAVDELAGDEGITADGDGRGVVELLADLPDLWDVNISEWDNDSQTARFAEEGFQEEFISWVKQATSKPVVGVGRYTSADRMVSLVNKGVMDLIGAARPSIADPYLPRKIEEGRIEDIRECIGCNICVTGDFLQVPMRCTQNPTKGEEWRRGWHPERIPEAGSDARVLIVGAGPAGLEAARAAGQRGYQVTLAEASTELGGRVDREARLPGLSSWGRVKDWRVGQIRKMPNVEVFMDSRLDAAQVREFGFDRVAIATGSTWCRDGMGKSNLKGIPGAGQAHVFTPDDLMAGTLPEGPVLVFDDDDYYMAGVLAELLVSQGRQVTYVTPAVDVSHWTHNTMEQHRIQARLIDLGVDIRVTANLAEIDEEEATLQSIYSGNPLHLEAAAVVLVTARRPDNALWAELAADPEALEAAGIGSLSRIGDCEAPATIAAAVHAGHLFARELDAEPAADVPFRREYMGLSTDWPVAV